ncbi:MAG: hypothetical protein IAX21_03595 [Candidatus Bathyarchaeota archaeon]|nr:MAG: hypothetical protein IAX21_03595 [Candidatus Bathyarchaeota archaeon]
MSSGIIFRSRISSEAHESNTYYTVDYDFKGAHGQKPHKQYARFYKKFYETFNQHISNFRSTASVLIIPTLDMAIKAAKLVMECGGTAYIRKCEKMDISY